MPINILSRTGGKLSRYLPSVTTDFNKFISWIKQQDWVAHDLETTFESEMHKRKMQLAQFYADDTVWVLFMEELTQEEWVKLKSVMQTTKFIIQNLVFEYREWLKHEITLYDWYDTYLAEKTLTMGYPDAKSGLADIVWQYLEIEMPKELQTSFTSNIEITDEQLGYAVKDVLYLHRIKKLQLNEIDKHDKKFQRFFKKKTTRGLKKTLWWNHKFIEVLALKGFHGIGFNKEKWGSLYEVAKPLVEKAEIRLNSIVKHSFIKEAGASGYYFDDDTPIAKLFSSSKKKLVLLNIIFPDIEKTSITELKKYLFFRDENWPTIKGKKISANSKYAHEYLRDDNKDVYSYIKILILGADDYFFQMLLNSKYKDKAIEKGLIIPKGTVSINWASPVQRKEIFQWIVPTLESTDRGHMEEIAYKHELLQVYLDDYQVNIGKVTKFGLKYFDHIEEDKRLRSYFNPILATGRISSSKPNLLNIINDAEYRSCFIPDKGMKYVMSDYISQELTITAVLAKENTWLDAIKNGYDLHSTNAQRIFPEWNNSAAADCAFIKDKSKCKCPKHKELRVKAKTAGFGILYGTSKYGLAFRNKIGVDEAEEIINGFFSAYPKIYKYLRAVGEFAVNNLFYPTPGFGSCRFVPKRKVYYDRSSVVRTSSNFSIQGTGAEILKVTTVLILRHIKVMQHKAFIVLTPYDEIILEVEESIAEYWQVKLKYFMELGARLILKQDILKADKPIIGDYWVH